MSLDQQWRAVTWPVSTLHFEMCSALNVFPRRDTTAKTQREADTRINDGHRSVLGHLKILTHPPLLFRLKATVKPFNILWPDLMATNQSHFDCFFILKWIHSWIRWESGSNNETLLTAAATITPSGGTQTSKYSLHF